MMIAKPEWFKRRKKDTVGIFGYPWQSIAYILLMFLLAVSLVLPESPMITIIIMLSFLFLSVNGLMAYQKSLDERQILNHAIIYRNAFLGMYITYLLTQIIPVNYNSNKEIFNLIGLLTAVGCLIAIITYCQLKGKLEMKILHKIANNNRNILIVRSEWFKRKNKSNYWILDMSWKGMAYILLILISFLTMLIKSVINTPESPVITIISNLLFLFLIVGYLVAFTKSLDERQKLHYAITYRNGFWGMVIVFVMIQPILVNYNLDPEDMFFLTTVLPLFIGFLISVVTYYKLQRELLFIGIIQ